MNDIVILMHEVGRLKVKELSEEAQRTKMLKTLNGDRKERISDHRIMQNLASEKHAYQGT